MCGRPAGARTGRIAAIATCVSGTATRQAGRRAEPEATIGLASALTGLLRRGATGLAGGEAGRRQDYGAVEGNPALASTDGWVWAPICTENPTLTPPGLHRARERGPREGGAYQIGLEGSQEGWCERAGPGPRLVLARAADLPAPGSPDARVEGSLQDPNLQWSLDFFLLS